MNALSNRIMRIISGVTLAAFTFSCVLAEPLSGAAEIVRAEQQAAAFREALERPLLPASIGRVTAGRLQDPGRLVVFIQDLHCHAEVQRNIERTIRFFDREDSVGRIFVEGAAAGKVDTSLLGSLPDDDFRRGTLDALLEKGLIGGAEYYAALERRDKLYGIEDWERYRENVRRMGGLFSGMKENRDHVSALERRIDALKRRYLSPRLLRLERRLGEPSRSTGRGDRYYLELEKLGRRSGEDIRAYPNLAKCVELVRLNRDIRFRRLPVQLQRCLQDLRNVLPYAAYRDLMGKLENGRNTDSFYQAFSRLAASVYPGLERRYPDLGLFLRYFRLNGDINPLRLLEEEEAFREAVVSRRAERLVEEEVLFLAGMARRLGEAVELKLTSERHAYFVRNAGRFAVGLRKYLPEEALGDIMALLEDKELQAFYSVNIERNGVFLRQLLDAPRAGVGGNRFAGPLAVMERLSDFDEIDIVVTGGFHSGILRPLEENGVSYLAVTPNVTKAYREDIYRQVMTGAIDLERIASAALAPVVAGWLESGDGYFPAKFMALLTVIIAQRRATGHTPERVLDDIRRWAASDARLDGLEVSYDARLNRWRAVLGEHSCDLSAAPEGGRGSGNFLSRNATSHLRTLLRLLRSAPHAMLAAFASVLGFAGTASASLISGPGAPAAWFPDLGMLSVAAGAVLVALAAHAPGKSADAADPASGEQERLEGVIAQVRDLQTDRANRPVIEELIAGILRDGEPLFSREEARSVASRHNPARGLEIVSMVFGLNGRPDPESRFVFQGRDLCALLKSHDSLNVVKDYLGYFLRVGLRDPEIIVRQLRSRELLETAAFIRRRSNERAVEIVRYSLASRVFPGPWSSAEIDEQHERMARVPDILGPDRLKELLRLLDERYLSIAEQDRLSEFVGIIRRALGRPPGEGGRGRGDGSAVDERRVLAEIIRDIRVLENGAGGNRDLIANLLSAVTRDGTRLFSDAGVGTILERKDVSAGLESVGELFSEKTRDGTGAYLLNGSQLSRIAKSVGNARTARLYRRYLQEIGINEGYYISEIMVGGGGFEECRERIEYLRNAGIADGHRISHIIIARTGLGTLRRFLEGIERLGPEGLRDYRTNRGQLNLYHALLGESAAGIRLEALNMLLPAWVDVRELGWDRIRIPYADARVLVGIAFNPSYRSEIIVAGVPLYVTPYLGLDGFDRLLRDLKERKILKSTSGHRNALLRCVPEEVRDECGWRQSRSQRRHEGEVTDEDVALDRFLFAAGIGIEDLVRRGITLASIREGIGQAEYEMLVELELKAARDEEEEERYLSLIKRARGLVRMEDAAGPPVPGPRGTGDEERFVAGVREAYDRLLRWNGKLGRKKAVELCMEITRGGMPLFSRRQGEWILAKAGNLSDSIAFLAELFGARRGDGKYLYSGADICTMMIALPKRGLRGTRELIRYLRVGGIDSGWTIKTVVVSGISFEQIRRLREAASEMPPEEWEWYESNLGQLKFYMRVFGEEAGGMSLDVLSLLIPSCVDRDALGWSAMQVPFSDAFFLCSLRPDMREIVADAGIIDLEDYVSFEGFNSLIRVLRKKNLLVSTSKKRSIFLRCVHPATRRHHGWVDTRTDISLERINEITEQRQKITDCLTELGAVSGDIGRINALAGELLSGLTREGRLFTEGHVKTILKAGDKSKALRILFELIGRTHAGGEYQFNGSQLAEIAANPRDVEETMEYIRFLETQGITEGARIRLFLRSSLTLDDVRWFRVGVLKLGPDELQRYRTNRGQLRLCTELMGDVVLAHSLAVLYDLLPETVDTKRLQWNRIILSYRDALLLSGLTMGAFDPATGEFGIGAARIPAGEGPAGFDAFREYLQHRGLIQSRARNRDAFLPCIPQEIKDFLGWYYRDVIETPYAEVRVPREGRATPQDVEDTVTITLARAHASLGPEKYDELLDLISREERSPDEERRYQELLRLLSGRLKTGEARREDSGGSGSLLDAPARRTLGADTASYRFYTTRLVNWEAIFFIPVLERFKYAATRWIGRTMLKTEVTARGQPWERTVMPALTLLLGIGLWAGGWAFAGAAAAWSLATGYLFAAAHRGGDGLPPDGRRFGALQAGGSALSAAIFIPAFLLSPGDAFTWAWASASGLFLNFALHSAYNGAFLSGRLPAWLPPASIRAGDFREPGGDDASGSTAPGIDEPVSLTFPFALDDHRRRALGILGDRGQADAGMLRTLLASGDFPAVLAALFVLRRDGGALLYGDRGILRQVLELSESRYPPVANAAIDTLGSVKDPALAPEVLDVAAGFAYDDGRRLLRAMASALGGVRDPRLLPETRKTLASLVRDVRARYAMEEFVEALGRTGTEEDLPLIELLAAKKNLTLSIRWAAIDALGHIGTGRAVTVLEGLAGDSDVRERIPRALGFVRGAGAEAAVEALARFASSGRAEPQAAAVSLGDIVQGARLPESVRARALEALRVLSRNAEESVRINALRAMARLGERSAFGPLRRAAFNASPHYRSLAIAALRYTPDGETTLNELLRGHDENARKQAAGLLSRMTGKTRAGLLATAAPWNATNFPEALADRMRALRETAETLSRQFGESFIGLIVLGSTAKGGLVPGSDLDYRLLRTDAAVDEAFGKLLNEKGLSGCESISHHVDPTARMDRETLADLFRGVFFGDRSAIGRLQAKVIGELDVNEWESLRQFAFEKETDLEKHLEPRFDITDAEEKERLKLAAALMRVPPVHDEAARATGGLNAWEATPGSILDLQARTALGGRSAAYRRYTTHLVHWEAVFVIPVLERFKYAAARWVSRTFFKTEVTARGQPWERVVMPALTVLLGAGFWYGGWLFAGVAAAWAAASGYAAATAHRDRSGLQLSAGALRWQWLVWSILSGSLFVPSLLFSPAAMTPFAGALSWWVSAAGGFLLHLALHSVHNLAVMRGWLERGADERIRELAVPTLSIPLSGARTTALRVFERPEELETDAALRLLASDDFPVVLATLNAASRSESFLSRPDRRLLDAILTLSGHRNRWIRVEALRALCALKDADDVEYVLGSRRELRPLVRESLAQAAAGIGGSRGYAILKSLSAHESWSVKGFAIDAMRDLRGVDARLQNEIVEHLSLFLTRYKPEPHYRSKVFTALAAIGGRRAYQVLLWSASSRDSREAEGAAAALCALRDPELLSLAVGFIEGLPLYQDAGARALLAGALGQQGPSSITTRVKGMLLDIGRRAGNDAGTRLAVFRAMYRFGMPGGAAGRRDMMLDTTLSMSDRLKALAALAGDRHVGAVPGADMLLKEAAGIDDHLQQEWVHHLLMRNTGGGRRAGFLWTSTPWMATAYPRELAGRLSKLHRVARVLAEEYGEDFPGFVVFGSMWKGHLIPDSDVDFALLSDDPGMEERLRVLLRAEGLEPCPQYHGRHFQEFSRSAGSLFPGLYFGDPKRLARHQRETFAGMSSDRWDELTQVVYFQFTEMAKAAWRFGPEILGDTSRLRIAFALYHVPPPFREMAAVLDAREGRFGERPAGSAASVLDMPARETLGDRSSAHRFYTTYLVNWEQVFFIPVLERFKYAAGRWAGRTFFKTEVTARGQPWERAVMPALTVLLGAGFWYGGWLFAGAAAAWSLVTGYLFAGAHRGVDGLPLSGRRFGALWAVGAILSGALFAPALLFSPPGITPWTGALSWAASVTSGFAVSFAVHSFYNFAWLKGWLPAWMRPASILQSGVARPTIDECRDELRKNLAEINRLYPALQASLARIADTLEAGGAEADTDAAHRRIQAAFEPVMVPARLIQQLPYEEIGMLRHDSGVGLIIFSRTYFAWVRDEGDEQQLLQALRETAASREVIENNKTVIRLLEGRGSVTNGNITGLVRERVELYREPAVSKGLTFTVDMPVPELVIPEVNKDELRTIVDNLLRNAIKFTEKGGIRVRLYRDSIAFEDGISRECAVFEVSDTGRGIPEDQLPRVLERGFRADNSGDTQGTGYGLANVYDRVAGMNGTVIVESILHKGSTFRVAIPLKQTAPAARQAIVARGVAASDFRFYTTYLVNWEAIFFIPVLERFKYAAARWVSRTFFKTEVTARGQPWERAVMPALTVLLGAGFWYGGSLFAGAAAAWSLATGYLFAGAHRGGDGLPLSGRRFGALWAVGAILSGALFAPALLFSPPGITPWTGALSWAASVTSGFAVNFAVHSFYNIAWLKGWLPAWMPPASILAGPQLTFPFPLSEQRKRALRIIEHPGMLDGKMFAGLIAHDDFPVTLALLHVYNRMESPPRDIGEETIDRLYAIAREDRDAVILREALTALVNAGRPDLVIRYLREFAGEPDDIFSVLVLTSVARSLRLVKDPAAALEVAQAVSRIAQSRAWRGSRHSSRIPYVLTPLAEALGDLTDVGTMSMLLDMAGPRYDADVRRAAIASLGRREGIDALETLEGLVADELPPISRSAVAAIGAFDDDALAGRADSFLRRLISGPDGDIDLLTAAIDALGERTSRENIPGFVPLLRPLTSRGNDRRVRGAAVRALGKTGLPELLPLYEDLADHAARWVVRREAIVAAGRISGPAAADAVAGWYGQLMERRDTDVRCAVAEGLGLLKHRRTVRLLDALAHSGDMKAALAAVRSLASCGLPGAATVLERLAGGGDGDLQLQDEARAALQRVAGKERARLLRTREPWLANVFPDEFDKRLRTFGTIAAALERSRGEKFAGIMIGGSMYRGHMTPRSDIDYAVLGAAPTAGEIISLAEQQGLMVGYDDIGDASGKEDKLFGGLFVGDRRRLAQEQAEVFSRLDRGRWAEIRRHTFMHDADMAKAVRRFGIEDRDEEDLLTVYGALLRVPPTYDETARLLASPSWTAGAPAGAGALARPAFSFDPGPERRAALRMLDDPGRADAGTVMRLLRSRDFPVVLAALETVAGSRALRADGGIRGRLAALAGDPNPHVQDAAIRAFGTVHTARQVPEVLAATGGAALDYEQKAALLARLAETLGEITDPREFPDARSVLKELARGGNKQIRAAAKGALANLRRLEAGKTLDGLEDTALAGDAGFNDAQAMVRAPELETRMEAYALMSRERGREPARYLNTEHPYLATHFPDALERRLRALDGMSAKLAEEFGGSYVGIIVLRSTAKGGLLPESDLDYVLLSADPRAERRFNELLTEHSLRKCWYHSSCVDPSGRMNDEKTAALFTGIFFGDRAALASAQRAALGRLTGRWDELRELMYHEVTDLGKTLARFGIDDPREVIGFQLRAALLRLPPVYDEAVRAAEGLTERGTMLGSVLDLQARSDMGEGTRAYRWYTMVAVNWEAVFFVPVLERFKYAVMRWVGRTLFKTEITARGRLWERVVMPVLTALLGAGLWCGGWLFAGAAVAWSLVTGYLFVAAHRDGDGLSLSGRRFGALWAAGALLSGALFAPALLFSPSGLTSWTGALSWFLSGVSGMSLSFALHSLYNHLVLNGRLKRAPLASLLEGDEDENPYDIIETLAKPAFPVPLSEDRRAAVRLLEQPESADRDTVVRLLGSDDLPVLLAALRTVNRSDDFISLDAGERGRLDAIERLVWHRDEEIYGAAMASLGNLGAADRIRNVLREAIQAGNRAMLNAVAKHLAAVRNPSVARDIVDILEMLLRDYRDRVLRDTVIETLGSINTFRSGALLWKIAGDPRENPYEREAALRSLARLQNLDALLQVARDEDLTKDEAVRCGIAQAFGLIEGGKRRRERAQALGRLLEDEDHYVQQYAAASLGMTGGKTAIPALRAQAETASFPPLQEAALFALGRLGDAKYLLPLIQPSGNRPAHVRAAAARGLGLAGRRNAIPKLRAIVMDAQDDDAVREAALESLGKLGGVSAVTEVLGRQRDVRIIAAATKLLGTLPGEDQVLSLGGLMRIPNREIRDAAQAAVMRKIAEERAFVLGTDTPWLAAAFPVELAGRLRMIDGIANELSRFPEFIGMLVRGSTHKGYFAPDSDIDFTLLASDRRVWKEFLRLVKERGLDCIMSTDEDDADGYIDPSRGTDTEAIARLFNGLFFGDRRKLEEARSAVAARTGISQWREVIDYTLMRLNTLSQKAFPRLGIDDPLERERLQLLFHLHHTPPPLEETRRIVDPVAGFRVRQGLNPDDPAAAGKHDREYLGYYRMNIGHGEQALREALERLDHDALTGMLRKLHPGGGWNDVGREVVIDYHDQGAFKRVFRVTFLTDAGSPLRVALLVGKHEGGIADGELRYQEELERSGIRVPRSGAAFPLADGTIVAFQEFIEGSTAKELAARGKLEGASLGSIVRFLLTVYRRAGSIPSDTHLANIMVAENGELVLIDVGKTRLLVLHGVLRKILHRVYGGHFPLTRGGSYLVYDAVREMFERPDEILAELLEHVKTSQRDEEQELRTGGPTKLLRESLALDTYFRSELEAYRSRRSPSVAPSARRPVAARPAPVFRVRPGVDYRNEHLLVSYAGDKYTEYRENIERGLRLVHESLGRMTPEELEDLLRRFHPVTDSTTLSGDVRVDYYAEGANKVMFLVTFTAADGTGIPVSLFARNLKTNRATLTGWVPSEEREYLRLLGEKGLRVPRPGIDCTLGSGELVFWREFIPGSTAEELMREGRFSLELRESVIRLLVTAFLRSGALPPDIKPANVLIEAGTGEAVFLDGGGVLNTSLPTALVNIYGMYGYGQTVPRGFFFRVVADVFREHAMAGDLEAGLAALLRFLDERIPALQHGIREYALKWSLPGHIFKAGLSATFMLRRELRAYVTEQTGVRIEGAYTVRPTVGLQDTDALRGRAGEGYAEYRGRLERGRDLLAAVLKRTGASGFSDLLDRAYPGRTGSPDHALTVDYFRSSNFKDVYRIECRLDSGVTAVLAMLVEKAEGKIGEEEVAYYRELEAAGLRLPRSGGDFMIDGRRVLLREFVEGPTAQELLEEGRLTRAHRREIARLILRMFQRTGSIPYDVKPDNFIISADNGEAVFVDPWYVKQPGFKQAMWTVRRLFGYAVDSASTDNAFVYDAVRDVFGETEGRRLLREACAFSREAGDVLSPHREELETYLSASLVVGAAGMLKDIAQPGNAVAGIVRGLLAEIEPDVKELEERRQKLERRGVPEEAARELARSADILIMTSGHAGEAGRLVAERREAGLMPFAVMPADPADGLPADAVVTRLDVPLGEARGGGYLLVELAVSLSQGRISYRVLPEERQTGTSAQRIASGGASVVSDDVTVRVALAVAHELYRQGPVRESAFPGGVWAIEHQAETNVRDKLDAFPELQQIVSRPWNDREDPGHVQANIGLFRASRREPGAGVSAFSRLAAMFPAAALADGTSPVGSLAGVIPFARNTGAGAVVIDGADDVLNVPWQREAAGVKNPEVSALLERLASMETDGGFVDARTLERARETALRIAGLVLNERSGGNVTEDAVRAYLREAVLRHLREAAEELGRTGVALTVDVSRFLEGDPERAVRDIADVMRISAVQMDMTGIIESDPAGADRILSALSREVTEGRIPAGRRHTVILPGAQSIARLDTFRHCGFEPAVRVQAGTPEGAFRGAALAGASLIVELDGADRPGAEALLRRAMQAGHIILRLARETPEGMTRLAKTGHDDVPGIVELINIALRLLPVTEVLDPGMRLDAARRLWRLTGLNHLQDGDIAALLRIDGAGSTLLGNMLEDVRAALRGPAAHGALAGSLERTERATLDSGLNPELKAVMAARMQDGRRALARAGDDADLMRLVVRELEAGLCALAGVAVLRSAGSELEDPAMERALGESAATLMSSFGFDDRGRPVFSGFDRFDPAVLPLALFARNAGLLTEDEAFSAASGAAEQVNEARMRELSAGELLVLIMLDDQAREAKTGARLLEPRRAAVLRALLDERLRDGFDPAGDPPGAIGFIAAERVLDRGDDAGRLERVKRHLSLAVRTRRWQESFNDARTSEDRPVLAARALAAVLILDVLAEPELPLILEDMKKGFEAGAIETIRRVLAAG